MNINDILTAPEATLRRVDEWLEIKYGNIENFRTNGAMMMGSRHVQYINSVPPYTTNTDAALKLCWKVIDHEVADIGFKLRFDEEWEVWVRRIDTHSLKAEIIKDITKLSVAIIVALLRAEGIKKLEV